jgi:hypothetical protein
MSMVTAAARQEGERMDVLKRSCGNTDNILRNIIGFTKGSLSK